MYIKCKAQYSADSQPFLGSKATMAMVSTLYLHRVKGQGFRLIPDSNQFTIKSHLSYNI